MEKKHYYITFWVNFHFLQNRANFWQTDCNCCCLSALHFREIRLKQKTQFSKQSLNSEFYKSGCWCNAKVDRYCTFQWHADSKIQSSTDKCVFRYRQSKIRWLLPASDYCRVHGNHIAVCSSDNEAVLGSSCKLGEAAEHLIDGSEKHICRSTFEF